MIIRKIFHIFKGCFILLMFFFLVPFAFVFYGKKRIWIVSEVDYDARDNGFWFFKYLNDKHPEINSVYLISKNNPNYTKVKNIGKIIEPKSLKHFVVFIAARVKASTIVHGCSPSGYITKALLLRHHFTGKNIALKHGIFKNLHPNYFESTAHLDLICCGTKAECDFINKEFDYKKAVAKFTGLARFDSLTDSTTIDEILIMPTWRRWLDNIKESSVFETTEFYKNWVSLLNNEKFIKIIDDHNLTVVFYIHPKLNFFINSFEHLSKRIIFKNSKNGDSVQQELKNAKVLITDFSSTFFDFAYLEKPAIYFQFDEKQYFENHYEKGYFEYSKDGFGPVCYKTEDVIDHLLHLAKNSFTLDSIYQKRVKDTFLIRDTNNCKRIFDEINKLL